jgi:hypothetical protein
MAIVNAAQAVVKTVADPNAAYETLKPVWKRCRAVCSGEKYVKDLDSVIDVFEFKNLLIPFSPTMSQNQYEFYKAEAELPGITAQFSKMLIGGLLRKQPILKFPEEVPEEVNNWIVNEFGADDSSLLAFLDEALWEEIQTSRAWVFVDFPAISDPDTLDPEEADKLKPYPILYKAEEIINWRTNTSDHGKSQLTQVIVKGFEESYEQNEFHPTFKETVWVHELDPAGKYQIRKFQVSAPATSVGVLIGTVQQTNTKARFEEVELINNIHVLGERLTFIPAWPLNGRIELCEPFMSNIVDKEVGLYNKISRRNHLLYGAATYTPYIASDMGQAAFEQIVDGGLGSWFHLAKGETADILKTPTEALADYAVSIAASIEEMAKLGIRMLTPETAQSGVALEIRNASQTAQLGTLNTRVCNTMRQVIAFMVGWKFGIAVDPSTITLILSEDFNPAPLGDTWLRLATEWYQASLIPRSAWLRLLKQNEMLASDYDDEAAQEELNNDESIMAQKQNEQYTLDIEQQKVALQQQKDNPPQNNKPPAKKEK